MAVVSVLNVGILNNPAPFTSPYQFEITFECLEPLQRDLDWKLTYVGSANSSEHDQELDSLLVGPVPLGTNKFVFEADPPDLTRIPTTELLGVTVILLSCSYDGREFIRIGYYVNNEYDSEELNTEPPMKPALDRIKRIILAEKPRVTRFAIKWDSEETAPAEFPPDQPEADQQEADGDTYGVEEEVAEAKALEADAIMQSEVKPDSMDVDMGNEAEGEKQENQLEDEEEESDDGSEDLEAPSSGDEEEDEEDEEGEEEGDEAMEDTEMGDHPMGSAPGDQKAPHQTAAVHS